ncbi:hypothetical protein AB1286_13810 [Trinickia sp. NRRL B-1857]|uniref:hypothetical protein n=1 Tax=Trinickia sp. NRRL B-1857 TaxID=3162879 RepID=UPI003D2C2D71
MACTAVASGSFALVTYAWRAFDADRRATEASALEALELRLQESRTKLVRLPAMRRSVNEQPAAAREPTRAIGAEWHALAELASQAGVSLRTLAPAAAGEAARAAKTSGAVRTLRVDGQADFAGLYAFFMGLSSLPMLVVPEAVDIKHDKGSLALGATLGVFDMPPSAAPKSTLAQASRPIADPFTGGDSAIGSAVSAGRLVGIVRDDRRALALFEAASGADAIAAVPGQTVGADRLVSIDTMGVTVASNGQTRRVAMSRDGR